jgi:hypothetical protein
VLARENLVELLVAELDHDERSSGVAYYAELRIRAGSTVTVGRGEVDAPWDALLGFVDREPMANWGHSCRYVLINAETGEVRSIEAQLPPFGPADERQWRVAYKAPSVPDAAVMRST